MQAIWEFVVRFRTWLFNVLALVLLVGPDLIVALLGYHWADIVPAKYMPLVTLAIIVINVLMRPRPASIASDPEVQVRKAISASPAPSTITVKTEGEPTAVICG
jgi:hypothetical protein